MYILGLNVFSHDTSAALFHKKELLIAVEEERFSKAKHTKNFPINSIKKCLEFAKINVSEVDKICIGWDINKILLERFLSQSSKESNLVKIFKERKEELDRIIDIKKQLGKLKFTCETLFYNHHDCHNAYSYATSDFKKSALLCLDGYGETKSSQIAFVNDNKKKILKEHNINNSLGLLYSAITNFLGFKSHCDEGIVMGLSSYGNYKNYLNTKQKYIDFFRKNIKFYKGDIKINRKFFSFGLTRKGWVTNHFVKIFGKHRTYNKPLTNHHKDISAALQKTLEQICQKICKFYFKKYRTKNLCLSGGVALNCVMNGKLHQITNFKNIHVPSCPGDAGVSVGACMMFLNDYYKENIKISNSPFLGIKYTKLTFKQLNKFFSKRKYKIFKLKNNYQKLSSFLHEGKIAATFVGRSEFGPRALGNRSILTRTYPGGMKDYLNNSVKFREEFRPFAPAVLDVYAKKYFDIKGESFNMTKTFSVKKIYKIEAVTHVDKSARVQVVRKKDNAFFYKLIENFHNFSGVPILLNTSFNIKGQPIVENIYDAIETFKKTKIDILVTENYFIKKVNENNNTRSE